MNENGTLFLVFVPANEISERLLGVFTSEAAAQKASKGSGWYGSDGRVEPVTMKDGIAICKR